ncbi:tetratricopeptide repeat protein [Sphaerisporangium aureirubrum]|uniref:Tetratricopeptide repeat protein n=1 Tax=Sphaerisporangium aureirubrum TaxID=1544736 RepID=A0ABW1NVJ5_9ACTN
MREEAGDRQDAERLARAAANRAAHLPALGISLNNHALRLAEVGRPDEALPICEEAVRLRRRLVELNRAAHLPDLAGSLDNHAALLAWVGRPDEALPICEEAVSLYRELVELNRDAYLPDLAMSVNNHAMWLAEVGRPDEALPVSQEAVRLRRELVQLNQDAYLPGYTKSLVVLGLVLIEGACFRKAIASLVEAFSTGQHLPDYAQGIIGTIIDLLRRAHAGDATGVSQEFRALTGQDVPEWMKQPPTSER